MVHGEVVTMSNKPSLAPGIDLDVHRLVDTRLLVQSNSGGGKSWALRRILEQTANHVQQIILDTEGEFSSLRAQFDYVICAASGADAIAAPKTATLLARRLRESRVSAIIDLFDMKMQDRRRFVRLFLEELIDAPKQHWYPAMVVVDEAHLFCPEKGEAESASAVIDLASRGRKRGLCAVLATQRLSKLHKDAAAELLNKMVGRTGLDVDVKRASDELGMTYKDGLPALRNLDPGEFFVFGPALTKTVIKIHVGPVVTKHPRIGERAMAPPEPSDKIKKILADLGDLPRDAEAEARTLAELRSELAAVKQELKKAQNQQKVPAVAPIVVAREPRKIPDVLKIIDQARAQIAALDTVPISTAKVMPVKTPPTMGNGIGIPGPQQRILNALAWFEAIGINEPLMPAVAFLAGYTVGGGAFNNPRGALRSSGLIEYRGDRMVLTDAGRSHAVMPDMPLDNNSLHEKVLSCLPGPEAKLLKALIGAYPDMISDDELAARTGYTAGGGAFNNPKGRLRTLGLAIYPERRHIRAADLLFPEIG